MPLVDVVDAGADAQLFEDPDPSHSEEDLLFDPRPRFGAVESFRDLPVLGGVSRDVGVQKIERDAPHLNLPDIGEERSPGEIQGDLHGVAPVVLDDLQRHSGEIVFRILLRLGAVFVDDLLEESVLVEKADADEGDVQVAGRLQVVSGEGAQASGIDGQAVVETVFGREVGDRLTTISVRQSGPISGEGVRSFIYSSNCRRIWS